MVDQAKLKKRAAEFEQKKQFDKALAVYAELLGPTERIDDLDIALFNKVGDLYLRQGQVSEALRSYERGVELYADRGFFTNAIALCNKILRQGVPRPDVLLRLGKIKIRTGFRSDAQQHFDEYVEHMRQAGAADVAFANLRSYAESEPENEDLQLVVADLLARGRQTAHAVALLDAFRARAQERGQMALVHSVVQRIRAIDPEYSPPANPDERRDEQGNVMDGAPASARPAPMAGLVFFEPEGHERTDTRPRVSRPTPIAPRTVRPSTPTPVYSTSIPGFSITPADGLVLDFMPQAEEARAADAAEAATVEAAAVEPPAGDLVADLPMLEPADPEREQADVVLADVAPLEVDEPESLRLETALTVPAFAASEREEPATEPRPAESMAFEPMEVESLVFEPLDVSPVAPLAVVPTSDAAILDEHFDLADDVRPSGDAGRGAIAPAEEEAASASAVDADAAFFVPDAVSLDDAPAGGPTLAADSVEALVAWIQPGSTDSLDFTGPLLGALPFPTEEDAGSGFGSTSFSAGEPFEPQDIEAEFAADRFPTVPPAAEPAPPAAGHSAVTDAFITPVEEPIEAQIEVQAEVQAGVQVEVQAGASDAAMDADQPIAAAPPGAEPPIAEAPAAVEPPRLESSGASQPTLADAQAYAQVGDRESAVRVLHELLQVHEQHARFTDVGEVLDELARVDPDSLAVHHKRVELACRLDDHTRLVNAYLGLAGALRRGGNANRARAVYQRVLDLEPELADAREAMDGEAGAPVQRRVAQPVPETGLESALDDEPEPGARIADAFVAAPAAPSPAHPPAQPPTSPRWPMMRSSAASSADGSDAAPGAPRRTEPVRSVPAPPLADGGAFVDLGDLLRDDDAPRSTRMVIEERAPTGDEQADFQEMLRKFKQGVSESVDEEDHESHYDLGVAYKEMGLVDEAIAAFQKALHGTDRRARTYEALGQCFVETRKFSVAAAVLRNALHEPGLDDRQLIGVLYLLGQAAEAVENQEEATVYYQRVFAVDVEFRDVSTRLDSLAQGAHPVSS